MSNAFLTQLTHLRGSSIKARALRASGVSIFQVSGANFLRLLSNLILTRLLFPEAFGLMALTQIFVYGLQSFSDIGMNTLVIQRKQAVEQGFLNVIWTLQVLRGGVLWALTSLIAWPLALIYDEPMLMWLLPVVGASALIDGFKPTREVMANRELQIGRVVVLGLVAQTLGLIAMAALAYVLQSVWALAFGTLCISTLRVMVMWLFLPGQVDRFAWDGQVLREVIGFGSFIFVATIANFFVTQAVQIILGGYLDAAMFGILSIALTLAGLSGLVAVQITRIVIMPLYRMKPPYESVSNQRNVFKARRMVALLAMGISAVLGVLSIWLIELLYDTRYALAGPMMLVIAARSLLVSPLIGTQDALLGCGDSKAHALLVCVQAVAQITSVYVGILWFGLLGGLLAPLAAMFLVYPLRAWLIARYAAWDTVGEIVMLSIGAVGAASLLWLHWTRFALLFDL